MALVYRDLGRHAEAAELLESALKSDLNNFGKDHPNVAIRQLNLAAVYIESDRKPEARVFLQAAYQNLLKNFGPAHPDTINIQKWFPHAEE
ncbi:MAG: tetratricopeptide repeat protein [Lewinellaceae bacterium]|nr:tetratricopeptide repeat protein [Lewinellaceae bacterium]